MMSFVQISHHLQLRDFAIVVSLGYFLEKLVLHLLCHNDGGVLSFQKGLDEFFRLSFLDETIVITVVYHPLLF